MNAMDSYTVRILEEHDEMIAVEALQRIIWPGDETAIVPAHLLLTAAHNGGFVIGAYQVMASSSTAPGEHPSRAIVVKTDDFNQSESLVGFVFGFPGLYNTPDGPRLKHCSHMLGVHPGLQNREIGFRLKRVQWQMVRRQAIDRITWTYDPLLSSNAYLNIVKLGAICNTYIRDAYGEMQDGLNSGLPSDRFQVDWWVDTARVHRRLSKKPRPRLTLAHYLAAHVAIINPGKFDVAGLLWPIETIDLHLEQLSTYRGQIVLVEIPADFLSIKARHLELALEWRIQARRVFEILFNQGFLVTDFIYEASLPARSFYVLSNGESTL